VHGDDFEGYVFIHEESSAFLQITRGEEGKNDDRHGTLYQVDV
jgi:hypothetical protein